jgi:polysaccharide biosynthesis protein PslH
MSYYLIEADMRILMISNYLPYPQNSGGRIRIYNLLRRVASHHEVSLIAFLESPSDAEGVSHLQQFCARVETVNFQERSRLAKVPDFLRYALEGKPPELTLLHSEELVDKIRQLCSMIDFDIVQIESVMGLYLGSLPQTGRYKSILMFQNFTFQQDSRVSGVERRFDRKVRALLNSVAMRYWEPRYAENFDRCTTVSRADQHLLMNANPRLHVDVIPNGVDIEKYQPLPQPADNALFSLLFIGTMGYPPCVDAVLYFCSEIFPVIRQAISTTEFWIVGRDPRPEVLELSGSDVHVTGQVEDVIPYYQQCAICVVPLRSGGGTRLKILEAMALGRPVVSTTIGCEGLDVVDGEHLLIADTPRQFAEKTMLLLNDRQLYQYITANGRKLVEAHYGWDKIADRLMDVYAEMVAKPSGERTGK